MRTFLKIVALAGVMAVIGGLYPAGLRAQAKRFVLTNDDVSGPNTVTVYVVKGTPTTPHLARIKTINTGGTGLGGGYFGIVRQVLLAQGAQQCAFVADGGSSDVAGIILNTQQVTGNFKGSSTDSGGTAAGIGLALNPNGQFLYAAFAGSSTIATFAIGSGCTLTFVSDVTATGVNGGFAHGMAANGATMVVAYGDGSIESFNIAGGAPVSNGDLQVSTGNLSAFVFPDGVIITPDGHFAIFGDASGSFSEVEVSDLSSGKLAATIAYGGASQALGSGTAANNVVLSPDQTLLYISDNLSGQVTAAKFNKTTGTLKFGCISPTLKGFGSFWIFSSAIAIEDTNGKGSVLWVAEDALGIIPSSIGIVEVSVTGGQCTLTEPAQSPATDPNTANLSWLDAFSLHSF